MSVQNKQRKICIATTDARSLGFYIGLSRILRDNGWNVTYMTGGDSNIFSRYYPSCDRVVYQKYLVRKPNLCYDLICFCSLFFFFLKNKFDVVYVASPKAGLLVSVASFLTGNRVLYSIIGRAYENFEGRKRRFYVLLDKIACFCAHKVVVISESLREAVLLDRCCSPQKILCVNTSPYVEDKSVHFTPSRFSKLDRLQLRENFGIPENGVVFSFVGRICRDKGVGELITAFQKIRQENVFLVLIGSDDDPERELGSSVWGYIDENNFVVRVGRVDFKDVPLYLYMSDIFVCPTYREARSGAGLEASLMELPVILTDAVGSRDSLIDGQTGIMVPIKQVEPLVKAMKLLLENPDLRTRMGKNGRQFVLERFKQPTENEIVSFFNDFLLASRS